MRLWCRQLDAVIEDEVLHHELVQQLGYVGEVRELPAGSQQRGAVHLDDAVNVLVSLR